MITSLNSLILIAVALAVYPTPSFQRRLFGQDFKLRQNSESKTAITRFGRGNRAVYLCLLCLIVLIAIVAVGMYGTVAGIIGVITARELWQQRQKRLKCGIELEAAIKSFESLISELQAGATQSAALQKTAMSFADDESALAHSLREAARRDGVGLPPWQQQLGAEGSRAESPDGVPTTRQLGHAWELSLQYGMPLVTVLETQLEDCRARRVHVAKTQAALAGPRTTIIILGLLPVFGVVLGTAFGAAPMAFLLGRHHPLGGVALVLGVSAACAGLWWANRIIARAEEAGV